MKRTISHIIQVMFLLCITLTAYSQEEEKRERTPYSMNEGTMFGLGSSHIKDTYLSPFNYNGWGFRILNERMKIISSGDGRISRQQFINVDITSTKNPAENVNDFGGFVDYSLGFHYRFNITPSFRLMAGASGHLMGGFIYNTRNGNNPLSAKVDLALNLSTIAMWNVKIKNQPLVLRYQLEAPVAGVFFSPGYGESYYEIFNAGNVVHTIGFNSFHNKFAIKNYFTIDVPCKGFTIRTGFLNSVYYTDSNDTQTRIISNSFLVGWVKEFIALGGKKNKKNMKINSSFY